MSRNSVLPAVAVFLVVFAVAVGGFVATRVSGAASGGGAATTMLERMLRGGPGSNVEVTPGVFPSALDQILNGGITNPADRITVPIHPKARLLGSAYTHQGTGADRVIVMYDVDGDIAEVVKTISEQLNQAPWTLVAGQGSETSQTVVFSNTKVQGLQGQAIVELNPEARTYRVTVARDGGETTLTMKRTALSPTIGGALTPDLVVQRVDPGPASDAGLKPGDRIVKVEGTAVKDARELTSALHAVAGAGARRSAVTYVIDSAAVAPPAPAPLVEPTVPVALPATFPAPQAWQGLSVLQYEWSPQEGQPGLAHQAAMISKDPPAAVATRVRDGLKAAGWTIVSDTPQGFATQLEIVKPSDRLIGQVAIDQAQDGSSFTQVVVQIQGAPAAGTP